MTTPTSPTSSSELLPNHSTPRGTSANLTRQTDSAKSGYPETKLATKLQLVSKLLKLGGGTRIYYVSQSGYDTHAAQLYTHSQLLHELAGALKAFLNDLKASKLDERIVVLAFSEFGRRVEENGSAGTDHGAAAPVFLAGSPVRGGLTGQHPSLTDLDQGDLKMAIDFRQVYATLLAQWLERRAAKRTWWTVRAVGTIEWMSLMAARLRLISAEHFVQSTTGWSKETAMPPPLARLRSEI